MYDWQLELVTVDYFKFNDILTRMVKLGQISNDERESLLTRAGLTKLEEGKWQEKPRYPEQGLPGATLHF